MYMCVFSECVKHCDDQEEIAMLEKNKEYYVQHVIYIH